LFLEKARERVLVVLLWFFVVRVICGSPFMVVEFTVCVSEFTVSVSSIGEAGITVSSLIGEAGITLFIGIR